MKDKIIILNVGKDGAGGNGSGIWIVIGSVMAVGMGVQSKMI